MTTKVERLQRSAAARSDVLSFAGGLPDPKMFPRAALTRAFLEAISARDASALQYGWPEGLPGLRELIAARLRKRGCRVDADDVLVTSGAQQAIALATELLFRRSKTIALDAETYPGALELFRARGLDVTCEPSRASVAYVMPQIDNPRGQIMSEGARRRWVERAGKGKVMLIEDDAYADIVFGGGPGRPLLADAPEATFHVGTFSKSLCPGLRVGWLVAPRRFREKARDLKRDSDLQANSLAQSILDAFFRHHDFDARIAKASRSYRRRAARLADALRRHLPDWSFVEPQGGFSIWVDVGEPGDDVALLERSTTFGSSFDPGSTFRVEPTATMRLRLCYSCLDEDFIDEGVKRLAKAWKARAGGRRASMAVPRSA